MIHRKTHPQDVPDCFGCKALGLSVATLKIKHGADPVQHIPVIRETGKRAGTVGGEHRLHWDGRQDAHVRPLPVAVKARVENV